MEWNLKRHKNNNKPYHPLISVFCKLLYNTKSKSSLHIAISNPSIIANLFPRIYTYTHGLQLHYSKKTFVLPSPNATNLHYNVNKRFNETQYLWFEYTFSCLQSFGAFEKLSNRHYSLVKQVVITSLWFITLHLHGQRIPLWCLSVTWERRTVRGTSYVEYKTRFSHRRSITYVWNILRTFHRVGWSRGCRDKDLIGKRLRGTEPAEPPR